MSRTALFPTLGILLLTALPAEAQRKEIIRLQADVAILQQHVRELQKSFDSQLAVLTNLVEKSFDLLAQMQAATEGNKAFSQRTEATVMAKIEALDTNFSSVNAGMDMVMDRINKLAMKMDEAKKTQVESLDARRPGIGTLSAEALYSAAYGDYSQGRYDLARQGFQEYVNVYPETELSDNALYWVGETYYSQKRYAEAVDAFDRVIQVYPKGNKVPDAILKKGYSYLELKNDRAGIKELRWVIQKHPDSKPAQLATDRLKEMGVSLRASRRARSR